MILCNLGRGIVEQGFLPTIELQTIIFENKPGARWLNDLGNSEYLIRELWVWDSPGKDPIRKGFDVEQNNWSSEVPWGAPNVANANRPIPHRIDAFATPEDHAVELADLVTSILKEKISAHKTKSDQTQSDYDEYCQKEGIKGYFACTRNTDDALTTFGVSILDNKAIAEQIQPSCVIGTTAWGFARDDLEAAFDYLFIDEAGQVSLANLIAMSQATKNIILMGDQMQLGQPSQGSHPEESGLSILDYLLHTTPTIPEDMGVFLGTTYRMHPAVNHFISEAIYEGKLGVADKNDRQCIKVPHGYKGVLNREAGIITVPVIHEGNTQASDEEVEQIVLLAQELIGRIFTDKDEVERPLGWDDMLFVAPYNHQVNKLKAALGKQAKVGSVDKFQGQEAPVVFLSMWDVSYKVWPASFVSRVLH